MKYLTKSEEKKSHSKNVLKFRNTHFLDLAESPKIGMKAARMHLGCRQERTVRDLFYEANQLLFKGSVFHHNISQEAKAYFQNIGKLRKGKTT